MKEGTQLPDIERIMEESRQGPTDIKGATVKVRLTLGPALIDLEATLEQIVVVVTRLTQEFSKAAIITSALSEEPSKPPKAA